MPYSRWPRCTIGDMLDSTAAEFPDRVAIAFKGLHLTYQAVQLLSDRFARGLLSMGIAPGDRVALWMANRPEWIVARFAIAKIGALLVPINVAVRDGELISILQHSEARAIVVGADCAHADFGAIIHSTCPELSAAAPGNLHSASLPALRAVIAASPNPSPGMLSWDEVLAAGGDLRSDLRGEDERVERQRAVDPGGVADIIYTSGTSGPPRGVMLSHEQMLKHMCEQGRALQLTEEDRIMVVPPFAHAFGSLGGVLLATIHGACCVPLERFDPVAALSLIEREQATLMNGSPLVYLAMLHHPDFGRYDLSSLRTAIIGAAPTPRSLIYEIRERMQLEHLLSGYGMTENCALTTQTCFGDPPEVVANTVGCPLPGYEVRLADLDSNETLPPGALGELCVRGYLVMKGYYRDPEETAKWIDGDGWWHTGDLAVLREDGYYSLRGRLKEVFAVGDQRVFPVEVESLLFEHPAVKQAQVIGIPDGSFGAVPMAWVELRHGHFATAEELVAHCRDRLPEYMVPRFVRFTREWPVTPSGKIRKFVLREWALPPHC